MGPLEQLAHELMQRELAKPSHEWEAQAPPRQEIQPLHPELAAGLGAGADALSTYSFLKKGVGTEGNPMLAKMFNQHPAKTAMGVAGGAAAMMGARQLLRKFGGGVGSKIADMLAGQGAAEQMSLAADNLDLLDVPYPGREQRRMDTRSSFEKTHERLQHGVTGLRK